MQGYQNVHLAPEEEINDLVDDMILKAFRIVTKGVRFLDIYDEDRRTRYPTISMMATVLEESLIPPTPPADQSSFDTRTEASGSYGSPSEANTAETTSDIVSCRPSEVSQLTVPPSSRRLSTLCSPPAHRLSQSSFHGQRLSAISHRHSRAGHSHVCEPENLVSAQMSRTHDVLLSQLGSFIGRLHLQSQSIPDLINAIKIAATSGGKLLAVIDVICVHDTVCGEMLGSIRSILFERVQELICAGQDIIAYAAADDADVVMPEHTTMLSNAATGCVRAAGEGVERANSVIARAGDFEAEVGETTAGIDVTTLDWTPEERPVTMIAPAVEPESDADTVAESTATSAATTPTESEDMAMPQLAVLPVDKPLPDVPAGTPIDETFLPQEDEPYLTSTPSRPSSAGTDAPSMVSSVSSLRPEIPPLPKLSTSLLPATTYKPDDSTNSAVDFHSASPYEGMTASSAGSTGTYLSQDSDYVVSHTSTRATTPDHTLGPKNQPSMSELSATGSATISEEAEVESALLEKTYAHELLFNKEGQVTGGSLAALVERMTAHDSTPDAMFVSTFYLTFRLFCTPVELAQTLIDRFEYVVDAPHVTGPVRLRVYNVLKGWLESHWRDETDREALDLIVPFAEVKLAAVIPSAGRRLLELAQRVSNEMSLVPRLVSSMAKMTQTQSVYTPADTPMSPPIISRSQVNSLVTWKSGGASPTILDFDPLELARQLTIKQMNVFCSILPEELLASQWMKNGGVDAPNVKAMSALSTDLSNLVAETILHYSEVKKRAAVIKQWIKIAHQCYELHNYDGLMAIICSLNSSTISRLRRTWDAISPKRREMLRTLQAVVEPSQNNKVLRGRLHDHVPPCLPFLGMYLTDLTFVDIGNAATKQLHGLGPGDDESAGFNVVNFDKHTRTAKIIGELQRFQIPYRLQEVPEMQDWMGTQIARVRLSEQPDNVQVSYYRKSLLLEPREMAAARTAADNASVANTPVQRGNTTTPRGATDLFGWMSRDRQAAPS
ncbi:hypothetical protein IMZ48_13100 [Candidatus Bathyarchaeota archaeon]|nr:hypothetical protein [Candidatus Bathyarchaeota archaeon]